MATVSEVASPAIDTSERVRELLIGAEREAGRIREAAAAEARSEQARAAADAERRAAEGIVRLRELRREVAERTGAAEQGLRRVADHLAVAAERLLREAAATELESPHATGKMDPGERQ